MANSTVELGLNRVIREVVLDEGGHFSPAGIDGVNTLTLLLSSQPADDHSVGNTRNTAEHRTGEKTNTWVQ